MFNPMEHMTPLKGKDYLQVMWRLVWFREDHPTWAIETKIENVDSTSAIFSCKIYDDNGHQVSSGHGSETSKDFGDFLEKAETKAVGRALAMLGYGTQFAPELDEEDRIVDSPVDRSKAQEAPKSAPLSKNAQILAEAVKCSKYSLISCEKWVKENLHKSIDEMTEEEVANLVAKIKGASDGTAGK